MKSLALKIKACPEWRKVRKLNPVQQQSFVKSSHGSVRNNKGGGYYGGNEEFGRVAVSEADIVIRSVDFTKKE